MIKGENGDNLLPTIKNRLNLVTALLLNGMKRRGRSLLGDLANFGRKQFGEEGLGSRGFKSCLRSTHKETAS